MEEAVPVPVAARRLYESFLIDETFKYAEKRLDTDNPAFYNLMREYEEGILLFEATKQTVWDRAGQDTTGLKTFFEAHRDDYRWDERVVLDVYTIDFDQEEKLLKPLSKFARKNSPEEVLAEFNTDDKKVVRHHERTVQRGREPMIDAIDWKPGKLTSPERDQVKKVIRLGVVQRAIAPQRKELKEARGYVIADYQDELEKRWVDDLAKTYEIEMNDSAFEAMIREAN